MCKLATGQIETINGRNPHIGNSRSLFTNTPVAKTLGTLPALNNAKNLIPGHGFSSIANVQSKIGNQNFASNLASANVLASSLNNKAVPNAPNFVNSQNLRSSANVASRTISGNKASEKALQYQLSGPNYSPVQNYNPTIFASNLAKGNLASTNQAKLAGRYPAGNAYSHSARQPGQQYGIHISSDGLQMAGNVAVTGNMPVHGAVSLNGKLPSRGISTVNYSSQGKIK